MTTGCLQRKRENLGIVINRHLEEMNATLLLRGTVHRKYYECKKTL